MEAILQKLMLLRTEAESKAAVSKARTRALVAVGLVLGVGASCTIAYIIFSSMSDPSVPQDQDSEWKKLIKPDLYICSGESEPPVEALKRAKRQRSNAPPTLIKRVPRPLSLPPPAHNLNLNFSYNPPLYHDIGARCAWGHLSNKRVPHLEDVGVAYDFQQLEARSCDDPEECKSLCLRMHKTDDPYLCNYFTWHRQKKLALFYFLEPTLKWNLTDDNRVETFFWQCRETQCSWWWRPHRIWTHLSDLTAAQLRRAPGLLAVTQCTDFASCQFSCETRPSFREIGQQLPEGALPDDPSCAYVVMPSKGTQNRESFLFTMPQNELKNVSYRGSSFYDSFELICDRPETTQFPTFGTTHAPVEVATIPQLGAAAAQPAVGAAAPPSEQRALPAAPAAISSIPVQPPSASAPAAETAPASQPQPLPPVAPPLPPQDNKIQTNDTQKRHLQKRETLSKGLKLRECRLKGELVDCARLQVIDKSHPSECVQLNAEIVSETAATVAFETKRPVWLVLQHQANSDDFEQSVQLSPGHKHTVDVLAQKLGSAAMEDQRCGPLHLRHRRCTTACTDRIAVDACGCTLTPEPADHESAAALLTVPVCDEEKVRSCVHPHMEQSSDAYFGCMKECKTECKAPMPFTLKSKTTAVSDSLGKDLIEMNLSFLGAPINARPLNSDTDAHRFISIWVPIMVMVVLMVAFILLYCARRLM